MSLCPFCNMERERIILENSRVYAVLDAFPVSPGHVLIIPKQHVQSLFKLAPDGQLSLLEALRQGRTMPESDYSPDGWKIGVNDGGAAGQTVMHLHIL